MKKIIVNKKCIGCGVCFAGCSYLKENKDGNAEAVQGKVILAKDLKDLEAIVQACPVHALEIVEKETKRKSGNQEVLKEFKKYVEQFRVEKVVPDDVKIVDPDTYIDTPYSRNEGSYDYRSKSDARSAASSDFRNSCYSENAYRKLLKKYFIDYKRLVLRPYYLCEEEESIYYRYNQQIKKVLADTYTEIVSNSEGEIYIPESWKEFSVYPKESERGIYGLKNFEECSTTSGIITRWKQMPNTDMEDYFRNVEYLDLGGNIDYAGTIWGIFSRSVEWAYIGVSEAMSKCCSDIARAVRYQEKEIEGQALEFIDAVMEEFEKQIKNCLKSKQQELEKILNRSGVNTRLENNIKSGEISTGRGDGETTEKSYSDEEVKKKLGLSSEELKRLSQEEIKFLMEALKENHLDCIDQIMKYLI